MNRLKNIGLLLAMLLVPALAMAQEARIAIVNTEQAVLKSADGDKANKEITKQYENKDKEFKEMQAKISQLESDLAVQGPLMTPEARLRKQRDIDDMKSTFKRALEDADRALDTLRREKFDPIIATAKTELDKLVTDKNYDLVLDAAGDGAAIIVWFSKKIDITDELVQRIDVARKSPAVAAPAPPAKVPSPAATKSTP